MLVLDFKKERDIQAKRGILGRYDRDPRATLFTLTSVLAILEKWFPLQGE